MLDVLFGSSSLVLPQDDDLISIVHIRFHKCLALKRAPIDDIDLFELSDFAPDLRVDLIATSTVSMTGNEHNFLKLVLS